MIEVMQVGVAFWADICNTDFEWPFSSQNTRKTTSSVYNNYELNDTMTEYLI